MKTTRIAGLVGLGTAGVMVATACGTSTAPTGTAGFNAAATSVVSPSSHKGGTLTFGDSSTPDSTDPGNTYYAHMWNFSRLYAMPLMTYKSCTGDCGSQVVPHLATAPGKVSNNGLTWTYHIKPNVKFEDGTTVTSADVKYAVERTYDRTKFPLGPNYFSLLLEPQTPAYPGPYQDTTPDKTGLKAVTTPNSTTVVFHLAKPFASFDYVAAIPQTAPVPRSKDTGSNYQLHPVSTGPYRFQSYHLNKQLTLVPNPQWNPATDQNTRRLVSKIVATFNMNANDLDSRLIAGDVDVDLAGTGVQAAARARILSTPSLKQQSDNPITGFLWLAYINTKVKPLDNVACRRAVQYAANKVNQQTAYGGPVAGGAIASTVAPPTLPGQKQFDLYAATTKPTGDLAQARQQLAECGQPNGFKTGISYRSDRPREQSAATALQASLDRVGIKTTLHGYPSGNYFTNFAGVPRFVHQHDLGILFGGWAPDWPDGYGFFDFLTAGDTISAAGNTNIAELNDPKVNSMLARMAQTSNAAQRNSYTSQIDRQVMNQAVILPQVYAKSLFYRPANLTNVYVQQYYGMYNFAVLGLK